MNLDEKKQIYLDRFPAIIGNRMADQCSIGKVDKREVLDHLIDNFTIWKETNEGDDFWYDISMLYFSNSVIEHQQILDIFHKHNIKP